MELLPAFNDELSTREVALKQWKKDVKDVRKAADEAQKKAADSMVRQHKRKHTPSEYNIGENVIIKLNVSKKKIKAEGLKTHYASPGTISKKDGERYQIQFTDSNGEVKKEWFPVSAITSETREKELEKKTKIEAKKDETAPSVQPDEASPNKSEPGNSQGNEGYAPQPEENILEKVLINSIMDSSEPVPIPDCLHDRLHLNNLEAVNVDGDGNCFFHAISHQIFHTTDHFSGVKDAAINQLTQNLHMYAGFIDGDVAAYIMQVSRRGAWADHVVVQATSDFFDVDIRIISSDPERFGDHLAEPSEPKAMTRSKVTLGYIAQNHYVSTRPIRPFETASWGGVTSEGKILENTCPLDGPLTWLMYILEEHDELAKVCGSSSHSLQDCLNLFRYDKSADAKVLWHEKFVGGTLVPARHQGPVDLFGSEAEQFFEPLMRDTLGRLFIGKRDVCSTNDCTDTEIAMNNVHISSQTNVNVEKRIQAFFQGEKLKCANCADGVVQRTIEALHLPPILVIPGDQIGENETLPQILNIERNNSFVTFLLMLVTVNRNNHFTAYCRSSSEPWCYYDGKKGSTLQLCNEPVSVGKPSCLAYVQLKYMKAGFQRTAMVMRRLSQGVGANTLRQGKFMMFTLIFYFIVKKWNSKT